MGRLENLRLRVHVAFFGVAASLACPAADPQTELALFTKFQQIDLQKLGSGDILSHRGSLMNFPRGITVQTCFVVMQPPATTVRLLQDWDPSPHKELSVYTHHVIQQVPSPADFLKLTLKDNLFEMKRLINKTLAATQDKFDLQLSRAEASQIAERVRQNAGNLTPKADLTATCWRDILYSRLQKFLRGGLTNLPPYEDMKNPILPSQEVASLLKENPLIANRFAALMTDPPLMPPPRPEQNLHLRSITGKCLKRSNSQRWISALFMPNQSTTTTRCWIASITSVPVIMYR